MCFSSIPRNSRLIRFDLIGKEHELSFVTELCNCAAQETVQLTVIQQKGLTKGQGAPLVHPKAAARF